MYWPITEEPLIYDNLSVKLLSEEKLLDTDILQRTISLNFNDTQTQVTQLHVRCWPDHSTPDLEIGYKMIEMLICYVDDFQTNFPENPIVVHCRYIKF